ncbi:glycosyltransferase [Acidipila sp. EB88]|uniref:glycosyltransferase n=1 Tax=Acidipila sp. EB88 TaxID=2305226 RepID=UPI000F5D5C04|nr:glycosyltransferase [Acidipila sp. EB88]RRA48301.1 glycosyltransferase [Acidipila sp. EB88]
MKVAIFCPTVSGKGGMESAIRNLMAGFEELGDDVRLFLLGGSFDEGWLEGLRYQQYGSTRDSRWKRMLHYATGPVRALLRWRPDAVICADLTTVQMARLARVVTANPGMLIASWVHFPVNEIRMQAQLRNVDLHLAVSSETADAIQKLPFANQKPVHTIFNAVDLRDATRIARPASTVFLYIGRLNYNDHKRTNDILEAAAELRGTWRLRLIGSPTQGFEEQETQLRELADKLGISDRIEWLGWQQHPWKAAGEATVFLASAQREAFGMVLVEAGSHGVAAISSDCTGPRDIIREGQNGWLYPVADVDALRARMQAVLDDPSILPAQDVVLASVQRFSGPATAQRAKDAFLQARK